MKKKIKMNAKITLINPEKKLSEFKSTFTSLKEDEPIKINIKSNELFENETRNNMVKWLVFLCDTLNFNFQTLNRAIIMTKLEEINCNYVKFFTDKVINLPDCQIFSVKDLTKMELIILKKLSFKTLYTTAYDFLLYFLDIFQYFYNPSNYFFENIKNHALFLMKQNINTNLYISMSQSDYAIFCLYQAFLEIGNNDIMQKILNILILLNNDIDNNDLKRQNRTDDISDKFEKIDIFRNSQVNIFSLSSF